MLLINAKLPQNLPGRQPERSVVQAAPPARWFSEIPRLRTRWDGAIGAEFAGTHRTGAWLLLQRCLLLNPCLESAAGHMDAFLEQSLRPYVPTVVLIKVTGTALFIK